MEKMMSFYSHKFYEFVHNCRFDQYVLIFSFFIILSLSLIIQIFIF